MKPGRDWSYIKDHAICIDSQDCIAKSQVCKNKFTCMPLISAKKNNYKKPFHLKAWGTKGYK